MSIKGADVDADAPLARAVGVHFRGDLRQVLVDAAVATLDDVGADRLSLREVARRAGVSHAAPAHHFGDKTGLLTVVATEGFELLVTYLSAVRADSADEPVGRLRVLGRAYVQFAQDNPGRFEVMFRPTLIEAGDGEFQRAGEAAFQTLRRLLAADQRRGWRADTDTDTLAAAAWALAHGIATLRMYGSLARHYPDPSLAAVDHLVTAMLGPAHW